MRRKSWWQATQRDPILPPAPSQRQHPQTRLPSYGAVHNEGNGGRTRGGAAGAEDEGWNHDISRSSSPERGDTSSSSWNERRNGQSYQQYDNERERNIEDWRNGRSHSLYSSSSAAAATANSNNNNGTALESLSARGIWFLLFIPYLTLTLALLVDTHPEYRATSLQPFPSASFPLDLCTAEGHRHDGVGGTAVGCVRRVNENFTAMYSPPFKVPVSTSFLNLDSFWEPGVRVIPVKGTQEEEVEEEEEEDLRDGLNNSSSRRSSLSSSTLGKVDGLSSFVSPPSSSPPSSSSSSSSSSTSSSSSSEATSPTEGDGGSNGGKKADDKKEEKGEEEGEEKVKRGGKAEVEGRGGELVVTAKLEVPFRDGSGWRVLYQGPSVSVRHLWKKKPYEKTESSTSTTTSSSSRSSSNSSSSGISSPSSLMVSGVPSSPSPSLPNTTVPLPSLPSTPPPPITFRLLTIIFDAPGMEDRGYPEYRLTVTIAGPDAASLAPHFGYTLHHDRPLYLFLIFLVRALLLLLTLCGSFRWHRLIRSQKPLGLCTWLPEQHYVGLVLLPALLLWQNPFALPLTFLFHPPPLLLFFSDLSNTIGYQSMLFAWVCIVDGLRCYEPLHATRIHAITTDATIRRPSFPPSSSSSTVWHHQPLPSEPDPYARFPITSSSLPPSSSSSLPSWPPKHHPLGDYFADFFLPKSSLYVLSLSLITFLCALRYPSLFFSPSYFSSTPSPSPFMGDSTPTADWSPPLPSFLYHIYPILSLLFLLSLFGWYMLFLCSVLLTGRSLRRQPYMRSRSQQLSFRFVSQEGFLILACKITILVLESARLTRLLLFGRGGGGEEGRAWSLFALASFQPLLGELTFISVTSYLMAYVFLPATRWSDSDVGGGGYPHVSLESELIPLPPSLIHRSSSFTQKLRSHLSLLPLALPPSLPPPPFCLETACWLMEASWQAYFDPPLSPSLPPFSPSSLPPLISTSMPGTMALEKISLSLRAYLFDDVTDTRAILAIVQGQGRGRGREGGCGKEGGLVLAFRGTLSSRNMMTDLKMGQVVLPSERVLKVMREAGREGGRAAAKVGIVGRDREREEEEEEEDEEVGMWTRRADSTGDLTPTGGPLRQGQQQQQELQRQRHNYSTGSLTQLAEWGGRGEGGEGGREEEDRYRRRVAGSPFHSRQGRRMEYRFSPRAADFVSSSPVALRWAGPADEKKGGEEGEKDVEVGKGRRSSSRRKNGQGGKRGGRRGGEGGGQLIRSLSSGATVNLLRSPTKQQQQQQQQQQEVEGEGGREGGRAMQVSQRRSSIASEYSNANPADAAAVDESALYASVASADHQPLISTPTLSSSAAPAPAPAAPAPAAVGNCFRRSLARLPALRHTLPHIHAGFWAAYLSIRTELLSAIQTALDEGVKGGGFLPHIYCTGHSLGGALAQLAAYDLSINFPCLVKDGGRIEVYTLGAPRVGNAAFASVYESRVPATFRVVVDGDLVPGMPKMFGMYRHAGVEVLVDADNGGNLIVEPSAVEKWLRLRNRTSATNHSLTAYRDCMEACFSPDDLRQYLPKVLGQDNRTSADEDLPEWLVGQRRSTFVM